MEDLGWMKRLAGGYMDFGGFCRMPFRVTVQRWGADEVWTVATDGKHLVGVKGDSAYPFLEDPALFNASKAIRSILISEGAGRFSIYLAELKAWAGSPGWPDGTPCPECKGDKVVTCKTCGGVGKHGDVECDLCGHKHICVCPDCEEGETSCGDCDATGLGGRNPKPRPGVIVLANLGEIVVDQIRLARVIDVFRDVEVSVSRENDGPLLVDGADWRAVVMPFNANPSGLPRIQAGSSV